MTASLAEKGTIRASSLTGFIDLVDRLGGDSTELLRENGIEPEELDNPDNVLHYSAVAGVIEESACRLQCPDFGLRLAEQQDLMILGQLAIMALNKPTVGSALDTIAQFINYYAAGLIVQLRHGWQPDKVLLELVINTSMENPRQVYELSVGVAYKIMRILSGDTFHANSVLVRTDSPLEQKRYWRFFHAPVALTQEVNGLLFDNGYLDKKIDINNPHLRDLVAHHIGGVVGTPPDSLRYRVETAIRRLLSTHRSTLKNVAQQLGMTPDELSTALQLEPIDFETLRDRIRRERADAYLCEEQIPIDQVAAMLGFDGKHELAEACRRWFDVSPLERRHHLRKQGP
ncbi:AraC family transcriptional regulator [Microbulbifer hainanensis]|uniref:AraC family transcriptional regulator n=1 Tax=Microbulbifer hainanensis TaxID=2735675 RepID=UPI001866E175|nr:AraC family transcriptional regulator [Microbulbifer hainanensis]